MPIVINCIEFKFVIVKVSELFKMIYMRKRTIFLIMILFGMHSLIAQNAKLQAAFVYSFTKFVSWPADMKSGNFVIAVAGDDGYMTELTAALNGKTVGTQAIEVIKQQAGKASHIVIVPSTASGNLGSVISATVGKSTLVVSDQSGGASKGAGINFVEKAGKQGFELNETELGKRGLNVGAQLKSLASSVL